MLQCTKNLYNNVMAGEFPHTPSQPNFELCWLGFKCGRQQSVGKHFPHLIVSVTGVPSLPSWAHKRANSISNLADCDDSLYGLSGSEIMHD